MMHLVFLPATEPGDKTYGEVPENVGFSKSGPGAWNIARTIPGLISGTIIFDAPVARESLPPWGTGPFYEDDASWQEDLPLNSVEEFRTAMSETHQLVLISGPGFHDEMSQLSAALSERGHRHAFLPRPHLKHHWNAGWMEEGLTALIKQRDEAGTRASGQNPAP